MLKGEKSGASKPQRGRIGGKFLSGSCRKVSLTRQSKSEGQVTGEKLKHEKILEKVYEPGRLYAAWQRVREMVFIKLPF